MIPGYKLVLDVSHYQKIDYKLVAPHIDGVIARCAFGIEPDKLFLAHYHGFKAEGKPVATYQWFRPDQDVKAQIETVKTLTNGTDVHMVFSDQEQHTPYGFPLPIYSDAKLSEAASAHMSGLKLHGFEIGMYSRATWITARSFSMTNWMYDYQVWLASWPYATGATYTSWDYLKSFWAPKAFSPYFTANWPADKRRADAWQWSGDKFILPGIYTTTGVARSVDLNFVSDELFAKFSAPVAVEPPVVVEPPIVDTMRNELYDLEQSMIGRKAAVGSLLDIDINELSAIRKMIPPKE